MCRGFYDPRLVGLDGVSPASPSRPSLSTFYPLASTLAAPHRVLHWGRSRWPHYYITRGMERVRLLAAPGYGRPSTDAFSRFPSTLHALSPLVFSLAFQIFRFFHFFFLFFLSFLTGGLQICFRATRVGMHRCFGGILETVRFVSRNLG